MGGGDANAAHNAWMGSPGHYKNIMNPLGTRVGLAVCGNKIGNQYWVAHFANEMISTGDQYLVNTASPLPQPQIQVKSDAPKLSPIPLINVLNAPVIKPLIRSQIATFVPKDSRNGKKSRNGCKHKTKKSARK